MIYKLQYFNSRIGKWVDLNAEDDFDTFEEAKQAYDRAIENGLLDANLRIEIA